MHIGAILLIVVIIICSLGPGAVIRALLGLATLVGILLATLWLLINCSPKDHSPVVQSEQLAPR
jgi:hypothetical protein